MLSDPLVLAASTTSIPAYSVGSNLNFRKIANGKATCVDAPHSVDQPAFLSVRQKPRKNALGAVSDFTVRYEQHFNAAPVNGITQPDVPLVVEVRVISYPANHVLADIIRGVNVAASTTQFFGTRLQGGEGI